MGRPLKAEPGIVLGVPQDDHKRAAGHAQVCQSMTDKEGPYTTPLVGWMDRHRGQAHTVWL